MAHCERLSKKSIGTSKSTRKLEFLVVVKESWKIKNGLLTPTLKIKRDIIESRYSAHIEAWYSQKTPVIWL
jgi:long-chain acyl-CoA synthetase